MIDSSAYSIANLITPGVIEPTVILSGSAAGLFPVQMTITFNLTSSLNTNNTLLIELPSDLQISSSMSCQALKGFA